MTNRYNPLCNTIDHQSVNIRTQDMWDTLLPDTPPPPPALTILLPICFYPLPPRQTKPGVLDAIFFPPISPKITTGFFKSQHVSKRFHFVNNDLKDAHQYYMCHGYNSVHKYIITTKATCTKNNHNISKYYSYNRIVQVRYM